MKTKPQSTSTALKSITLTMPDDWQAFQLLIDTIKSVKCTSITINVYQSFNTTKVGGDFITQTGNGNAVGSQHIKTTVGMGGPSYEQ